MKEFSGRKLLDWYDRNRRRLPWRESRDPYRIWVSEIMLQQTQVKTVLAYYERFMDLFPSVEALAAAPIDEVLASWSGLGYYRRARQMHAAALAIVDRGGFPRTVAGLRELPGVGAYTAAAVASMAFGATVAVVDGNVERLLCRWQGIEGDPKRVAVRRQLTAVAEDLLDRSRPGDGNQALMELGATICTPRRPRCEVCPLSPGCAARRSGAPESFPAPRRRRARERVAWAVAVVEREGWILLVRRSPTSELLSGLWELPNVVLVPNGDSDSTAGALAEKYGGRWRLGEARASVRHAITFRTLTLRVHSASYRGRLRAPEIAWIRLAERSRYALSSMFEKVLERFSG